ncbi:MAG TPA: mycothione reductase [Nocardioidaceae bacterium]|nr:mycothione reductase [Nocardioidaceae bacterium]
MHHFDLAVIGTGSGNTIVDERFADRSVAILEHGTFGGTCLNVGCIPTKMFVYPADVISAAAHGDRLGVHARVEGVDWPAVRDRVFGRIDPISASGRTWRAEKNPNVTLFESHARFVGDRTIDTGGGETITADDVVVAAGSRVIVPDIDGLPPVGSGRVHSSDTIMRLDELPSRVGIVGGGFVASEFAHIFASFGTRVSVLVRSDAMLRAEDEEVSARFTELAGERWDVRLHTEIRKVEEYGDGLRLHLSEGSVLDVDVLLVATGRTSNSDGLDLDRAGVDVDADGLVVVDEFQRTTARRVWALGDVANAFQLKHVANEEARVVQHNLLYPDDMIATRHHAVPSAVFTEPQVAKVGLTEQQARALGLEYVVARQSYSGTAYGWAMEDTTGFAKLLAEPGTGRILGAHILGPQASNLIQPLIAAMSFGQSAHDVARGQYWIHPALMEVTENLLLGVERARRG